MPPRAMAGVIDWRAALNYCPRGTYAIWEEATQAGEIIRQPNGMRLYWISGAENRPTSEQRRAVSTGVQPLQDGFQAACACCKITYAIPTEWQHIRDFGVCQTCRPYADGEVPGVLAQRLPTIEEVMSLPVTEPLAPNEVYVLREALREAYRTMSKVPHG